jgi:hypothetical protein
LNVEIAKVHENIDIYGGGEWEKFFLQMEGTSSFPIKAIWPKKLLILQGQK